MWGLGVLVLLTFLTGCLDVSIPTGGTGTAGPTCPAPPGASASPFPWATLGDPGAAPGRRAAGGTTLGTAAADDLRVSQEPERAQVAPGAEVTLGCRVVAAAPWELLRLEWHKEGGREALCVARLRPAAAAAETPCAPRLRLAWHPPCATLRLRGAHPGDTGRYVCRATLEIPRLAAASGNGTLLGVGAGLPGGLAGGLAGGLGGSALLLLLLLLGLALGCCWRRCRKADTVTYANALPRSARAPKELVPLVEMHSSTYQGGLQRARPPRPPACPRPPGAPDACCAKP